MDAKKAPERSNSSHPLIKALGILLILLPVVLGFLYVGRFGVDVPFGDAWTMVDRFVKLSQGRLGFYDLWVQHYEHRLFFPRVAILLLGIPTDFDNVAIMYMIMAFFVATLAVLLVAFRDTIGPRYLLFVPIAFLIFSFRQWFNMFNAFQLAFPMAQAFAVLAFYLLYLVGHKGRVKLAFPAAMVSATVASFSFLVGLFAWPVGLLQLLVARQERRTKWTLVGIWALAGVAVWAAYLYGLEVPKRQQEFYFATDPLLLVEYFATALGAPLFQEPVLALAGGGVLAIIIAASLYFVYRARGWSACSFWLAVLAFSLVILASQTLGRAGGGIPSALQPRYITFSGLAVIGVYALLLKLAIERGSRAISVSLVVVSALVVASIPASYALGIQTAERLEIRRSMDAELLSTYRSQPDPELRILNRSPQLIKAKAYEMCRLGLSTFSDPAARARNCLPPDFAGLDPIEQDTLSGVSTVSGNRLSRERVENPIVIDSGRVSTFRASGWAVDEPNQRSAGGVYVQIDGERFPAFYGDNRPSIASRLGAPAYRYSGFELEVPMDEIGPGRHTLSVVTVDSAREGYYRPGREIPFEVR